MNRALLLDRDGVINKEINYLHRIEDFEFIDGVFESCKFFADRGYLIIVITNQAGIGRGYYTEADFWHLSECMVQEFKKRGVDIAKIYFCPYHADGVGEYRRESYDRKPNPGMILQAQVEFELDIKSCILVGDKETDIEAGINAGVGINVLVKSGHAIDGRSRADLVIDSVGGLPNALDQR